MSDAVAVWKDVMDDFSDHLLIGAILFAFGFVQIALANEHPEELGGLANELLLGMDYFGVLSLLIAAYIMKPFLDSGIDHWEKAAGKAAILFFCLSLVVVAAV